METEFQTEYHGNLRGPLKGIPGFLREIIMVNSPSIRFPLFLGEVDTKGFTWAMISVRENRRNCLFCLHNLDPAVAPLAKQILGVFHVLLTEISCKI